jgi:hypothetical protein
VTHLVNWFATQKRGGEVHGLRLFAQVVAHLRGETLTCILAACSTSLCGWPNTWRVLGCSDSHGRR